MRVPRVKILDLGLARVERAGSSDSPNLTQAGEFLGTVDYISPEQADDPRQVDIRSDIYSLGGTLFFLLTGEVPFPGGSLVQKLRRQLAEPVPHITQRRPDLPAALADLAACMMAKSPDDRFSTPEEVVKAIDAYLNGVHWPSPRPTAEAKAPSTTIALTAASIRAHSPGVQALAISPDGRLLATGGLDDSLRLWDASRLREVRTFAQDPGSVSQVAFNPSGKWLASCALRLMQEDMVVQLWDVATGSERRRLRGHTNNVTCLAIAPDGRRVAAGGADRTIRLWKLDTHDPPLCFTGHTAQLSSIAFLPSGASFLSGSHDGTVRMWESATGASRGIIKAGVGRVHAVAIRGNRMAMAGDADEYLRVRQPDGSFVRLNGHDGAVLCLAFSSDGKLLLSGGADHAVVLWRLEDGAELARFQGHTGRIHAVAFLPDARAAFSASADGTVRRWPLT
jgi:WD40 repeat protein